MNITTEETVKIRKESVKTTHIPLINSRFLTKQDTINVIKETVDKTVLHLTSDADTTGFNPVTTSQAYTTTADILKETLQEYLTDTHTIVEKATTAHTIERTYTAITPVEDKQTNYPDSITRKNVLYAFIISFIKTTLTGIRQLIENDTITTSLNPFQLTKTLTQHTNTEHTQTENET